MGLPGRVWGRGGPSVTGHGVARAGAGTGRAARPGEIKGGAGGASGGLGWPDRGRGGWPGRGRGRGDGGAEAGGGGVDRGAALVERATAWKKGAAAAGQKGGSERRRE
nr:rRNA 2'-O-methyltransferase fibrillarin-like [Aegilops tauschii subsp. strangulata]